MGKFTRRETCRVCNSPMTDVIGLGDHQVVDFIPLGQQSDRPIAPLTLAMCQECRLVQLRDTVAPEFLYERFFYRSGINPMMRAALRDITKSIEDRGILQPYDPVLDIGANDFTMLDTYTIPNLFRVGVDPCSELVNEARQSGRAEACIPAYFNKVTALSPLVSGRKYKVITAIAMFYDLEDPNQFVSDVKECLAEDGLFVIQMNYLLGMLKLNAFDNICHEHLEYYSLYTLERLLDRHSLEVVDVSLNDVNGGSFRVYVTHKGQGGSIEGAKNVAKVRALERAEAAETQEAMLAFGLRTTRILWALKDALDAAPKPIFCYGASTRGSTLMQALTQKGGLRTLDFHGAAERDPRKFGLRMAGTFLPIVSEADARQRAKTFLCLPWHFWPHIAEREKEWIENGGHFIVPLPIPRLVTNRGAKELVTFP